MFYNHFTDADTPCTVTEYDDATWKVVNAYGYEGMTLSWSINEDGTIKFAYSDPTASYAGFYFTSDDDSDYVWIYNNGYSAYEETSYNGKDIYFYSYNSSNANGGYDAIYWGLPEVTATYTGTYQNGMQPRPYEVTIDELDNGLLRVNDFYGYEDYHLYLDLSGDAPVVVNAEADEEGADPYVCAGWYYTNPVTYEYTYVYVYPDKNNAATYTSNENGKTVNLPVIVKADNIADLSNTDVINWGSSSLIEGVTVDGQSTNGQAYNLLGLPVNDSYRGIVIINGKKVMRK